MASKTKANTRDKFIARLLKRMTLEEKLGQLNLLSLGFDVTGPVLSEGVEEKIKKGLVGGVFNSYTPVAVRKLQDLAINHTRLGIPLLLGYDVIHGHRTTFPINLGLACSWDLDLIERAARAAAAEATADGINWIFSPMVDIARDPRWGRVSEGSGECAFLGSAIARATVHGYQGTDLRDPTNAMACVKHFALYGAAEAGRDYNTVDMSRERMHNEYLPPYKAAFEAGARSVMTSFNEINGRPASGNKWLFTDLLRKQWGFDHVLAATDYTAINEMIGHGMGDEADVAALALNAGVDMDMVGELLVKHGQSLAKSKRVPMKQINAACQRVLEAKYDLGLFDDPYRGVSDERAKAEIGSPDKLQLAKEAATKSIVLLKNEGSVLPLDVQKKVAFIGPLVKDQRNLIGSWSAAGDPKKAVSLWTALTQKFGVEKFLYAKGCNLLDDGQIVLDERSPAELMEEAVATANGADLVVAVLGEPFGMTGEAACRSEIGLLPNQLELLKALKATGKPIVLVLMNGRPLTLPWENANIDAILETWFAGHMAGPAIRDVLFGDANPSGKLTMSFPHNVGQIPIYHNHKNTGRLFDPSRDLDKYVSRYLDVPNTPLFPFGWGMSYTTFEYSDITLSKDVLKPGGSLHASVTVTNTGARAGAEVVQMYIRDLQGTLTRPVKELKGFRRIELQPGESKTVTFEVSTQDLKYYVSGRGFRAEPGAFKLFIGGNSRDVREARFELVARKVRR
jgi:beta-glucosidase